MTGDQPNNPKRHAKAEGQPWWNFWGTNGGAAGSHNMDANAAFEYWVSGGLRIPWIEAWNYLYLFTGLFVYIFLCPLDHAATLEWGWVSFVVVRNLCMYCITFGGTHHLLYISSVKDELVKKGLKFNAKFPGEGSARFPTGWAPLATTLRYMLTGRGKELHRLGAQHSHDCFMTTTSCLISAAIEVCFLHGWASGQLPLLPTAELFRPYSLALMFILPFFRNAHFYATHRMMHCKFLYKHVHSLHHRSVNTGPWSGLRWVSISLKSILSPT
jgi:hypothetical protein